MDDQFLRKQRQQTSVFSQEVQIEKEQQKTGLAYAEQTQFAQREESLTRSPLLFENIGIMTVKSDAGILTPGGESPEGPVYTPIKKKHAKVLAYDEARMDKIKTAIDRYNEAGESGSDDLAQCAHDVALSARNYARLSFSMLRGVRGKHRRRELRALCRETEQRAQRGGLTAEGFAKESINKATVQEDWKVTAPFSAVQLELSGK